MEKHILSKSTFIRGTQCLKSLYLNKNRPFLRNRLSDAQRAVFKRGTDVGVLAQQLFPEGINLKPRSPALYRKQVDETTAVIRNNSHFTLYEATFQYDRLLAILDILVKSQNGWTAYEVKSSLKISETFLRDAAFQYYVITHSGISLEDFYLVYMNQDYVLEKELAIDQLFIKQSVLEEVKTRQSYIEEQIESSKEALNASSSPQIAIGTHCFSPYPCDFRGHCWKKVAENSLLYLHAFDESERFSRYYAGNDLPENMETGELSPLQEIQLTSAKEKVLVISKKKMKAFTVQHLQFPVMVSVLFVKPAVPYLKDTKPYQLIPVAAMSRAIDGDPKFFIQENNPYKSFKTYFRNLLTNNYDIVVYDKREVMMILREVADPDLLERAGNKLFDFRHLFDKAVLSHYLLRGDYSPENVARIIMGVQSPGLNPALLGMKWQRRLFETSHDFFDLRIETKEFLNRMLIFQIDLVNYLKSNS